MLKTKGAPVRPARSPLRLRKTLTKSVMAIETEMTSCREHGGAEVIMLCQTCEELLCTKCLCQGPNSPGKHTGHVCLDLQEAFSIYMADIEDLIERVSASLDTMKERRKVAQRRLQNIKFDLLRKRSFVERRKRSLLERIHKAEEVFQQRLGDLVAEPLEKEILRFRDLDYDVVDHEGMLCVLESLVQMDSHDSVPFIKNFFKIRKDISEKLTAEASKNSAPDVSTDVSRECALIRLVNPTLSAEKCVIGRALEMPIEAPWKPQLLPSWCVIGSTGASLVWKQDSTIRADKFHLYYCAALSQPSLVLRRLIGFRGGSQGHKYGSNYIKIIIKSTSKRCQAVLRNLVPNTDYDVIICAVNAVGESDVEKASFRTGEKLATQHPVQMDGCLPLFRFRPEDILHASVALLAVSAFLFTLLCVLGATFENQLCQRLAAEDDGAILRSICPQKYQGMLNRKLERERALLDASGEPGHGTVDILEASLSILARYYRTAIEKLF